MNKLRGVAAVIVLGMLLLLSSGGPAAASAGSNWVGVAQIVTVSTSANGQVSGTPVVFTQLAANGSGPVTVRVPMSASGFRNLTGLGTPPISNGKAVWDLHLSGQTSERTIAHFPPARLPFVVHATYELNGKTMTASDIVGKSGHLKVTYNIINTTTEATTVTFKNVFGAKETRTVRAPVPYAGVFDVTLPARFTNLKAPGATVNGDGNGNVAASWTMFLFNPLGGVHQSVTYQAQVTNAIVPSATLSGQALPPESGKPLPTISEPQAPAVPTVTLGARLGSLQAGVQLKLHQLAAKASTVLTELKAVMVHAAQDVSNGTAAVSQASAAASTGVGRVSSGVAHVSGDVAKVASLLGTLSVGAGRLSTVAGDVSDRLARSAAEASAIASMVANVRTKLTELPAAICDALGRIIKAPHACESTVAAMPKFRLLDRRVTALEALVLAHAARLGADSGTAKTLRALAVSTSARLTAGSTRTKSLSAQLAALSPQLAALPPKFTGLSARAAAVAAKAAQVAGTLATALTPKPGHRHGKAIHPRQVGGGKHLDAAVGKLDAAISDVGTKVNDDYAYLAALNTRARRTQLPAGNASGATVQSGAVTYSISGANRIQHNITLAAYIGALALLLGATLGLGLYRIRLGEPSSLAPPKTPKTPKSPSSPAPAKA
jgi:putative membrane protein